MIKLILKTIKAFISVTLLITLILIGNATWDMGKVWVKTRYIGDKIVSFNSGNKIMGTGFHIQYKDKYYILTNAHVCRLQDIIQIKISKEGAITIVKPRFTIQGKKPVKILAVSKSHDLCLVESDKKEGLRLGNGPLLREPVLIAGHPRGLGLTFRTGYVVDFESVFAPWINRTFPVTAFMVSTIGYGGNSGSPVIGMFGQVIGIIFAGDRRYHTEMKAVPAHAIHVFLQRYHERNNIK